MRFHAIAEILAVLLLAAFGSLEAQERSSGTVLRQSIASRSLGRPYWFRVYLPPGHKASPARYPVIYLLHGGNGDENSWWAQGRLREVADSLISSNDIPPAIFVTPGDSSSWWIDGSKKKSESALVSELVTHIDRQFPTRADRESRIIGGNSMGGYGAVRIALKYPELFGGVLALSPAIWTEAPSPQSTSRSHGQFAGPDGTFSLQLWQQNNYPTLLPKYVEQPIRLPFFIAVGDSDGLGLTPDALRLFESLYRIQPALTDLRVVDGGHDWSVWSTTMAAGLKRLMAPLKHE